jgi:hypothetical protein
MVAADTATLDSPVLLLCGFLLLWFYTVWQTYVIEGTHARLAGLQEVWRETVSLDPAWRYLPEVRIVERLLESSTERLPRLSLASLFMATLAPSGERGAASAKIYERLNRLPPRRLREESIVIVEAATRYVVLAALKRSLLAWLLAPLALAVFIVWSFYWQLRVAVEGLPQASLRLAGIRLRRKMLGLLLGVVTSQRA